SRMHAVGLSQGDQLAAFDTAKVVQASGASKVLTGTVIQFKTVNVGIYQSHVVVVQYRLIDAAGHDLWTAPGYGVPEMVRRPRRPKRQQGLDLRGAGAQADRDRRQVSGHPLAGLQPVHGPPGACGEA